MKITSIDLKNIRGFKELKETPLSNTINIFVGANNSGKSTILQCIYTLQKDGMINAGDITIGEKNGEIILSFEGGHLPQFVDKPLENQKYVHYPINGNRKIITVNGGHTDLGAIDNQEPSNLIYPYLSKRKVAIYNDTINESNSNSIVGNFTHLFSKIDRLATTELDAHKLYLKACNEILGFRISSITKGNGKQSVYLVEDLVHIPLTSMGEGVANMLGLIVDLCVAKDKIFIIEEPENDIHPRALKALLDFILEKSDTNQFFISTHSNIVLKHLGSDHNTKIFNIENNLSSDKYNKLFLSSMTKVANDPLSRREVLEKLGYEFNDFGQWDAWLFLEESSAEYIIRDWLIKWFVPELDNRIRTHSSRGIGEILQRFNDFNKLFSFLNLEPVYKNKAWVLIDGGQQEEKVIQELKKVYVPNGWNESQFIQLAEHDFERYYPAVFKASVEEIYNESDPNKRRSLKLKLLETVKVWISNNEEEAKKEFANSASDVVEKLKLIANQLKPLK